MSFILDVYAIIVLNFDLVIGRFCSDHQEHNFWIVSKFRYGCWFSRSFYVWTVIISGCNSKDNEDEETVKASTVTGWSAKPTLSKIQTQGPCY